MPDASPPPAGADFTALLNQHQQLWQLWLATDGSDPPTFSALLRRWQSETGAREAMPEELARLLAQGEAFIRLAEESLLLLKGAGSAGPDDDAGWRRLYQAFPNPFFDGSEAIALPDVPDWDALRRSLPPALQALLPWVEVSDWGHGNPLQAELRKALNLPGLGLSGAGWQRWQTLGAYWDDYREADRALRDQLAASSRQAFADLQARLAARVARGEAVTSLREFYDLWIDASEQAYAAMLRSAEYAAIQGRVINAMLRCRRQTQLIAADLLQVFDLPGRSELDATAAALHETRQHVRALEDQVRKLLQQAPSERSDRPRAPRRRRRPPSSAD